MGPPQRGKQNHKCRDCGGQFVETPQWHKGTTEEFTSHVKLSLPREICQTNATGKGLGLTR